MEQFYQDVMIDDFDANVAIQCSSNESCDEIGCVCQCLQAVKRNTLVRELIGNCKSAIRLDMYISGG